MISVDCVQTQQYYLLLLRVYIRSLSFHEQRDSNANSVAASVFIFLRSILGLFILSYIFLTVLCIVWSYSTVISWMTWKMCLGYGILLQLCKGMLHLLNDVKMCYIHPCCIFFRFLLTPYSQLVGMVLLASPDLNSLCVPVWHWTCQISSWLCLQRVEIANMNQHTQPMSQFSKWLSKHTLQPSLIRSNIFTCFMQ